MVWCGEARAPINVYILLVYYCKCANNQLQEFEIMQLNLMIL